MKKAYLAISYSRRKEFDVEVTALTQWLAQRGIDLFVFVDRYNFTGDQEVEMMATAFREIAESDLLIAELTHKAMGVGIELGYAFGQNIPIVYVRKTGAEHSTTAAGCADHIVTYSSPATLLEGMDSALKAITNLE